MVEDHIHERQGVWKRKLEDIGKKPTFLPPQTYI